MRDYITNSKNDCGPNADRIHKHWTDQGYQARIVRYWRAGGTGHTFVVIKTQNGLAAEDDSRAAFKLFTMPSAWDSPRLLAECFEYRLGHLTTEITKAIFA